MTVIPYLPGPAGFESLVALHRAEVLRVCRAILREEDLSLDAAQETFVRFWRRLGRTGTPDDSASWLRRTAAHVAIDLVRERARTGRRAGELVEDALALPARDAEPADALVRAELGQRLAAALAGLPEGQRTIFLLRHEGGLSLAEVARTLELAPATVRTQFARAALALQSRLSRTHDDEELR